MAASDESLSERISPGTVPLTVHKLHPNESCGVLHAIPTRINALNARDGAQSVASWWNYKALAEVAARVQSESTLLLAADESVQTPAPEPYAPPQTFNVSGRI